MALNSPSQFNSKVVAFLRRVMNLRKECIFEHRLKKLAMLHKLSVPKRCRIHDEPSEPSQTKPNVANQPKKDHIE